MKDKQKETDHNQNCHNEKHGGCEKNCSCDKKAEKPANEEKQNTISVSKQEYEHLKAEVEKTQKAFNEYEKTVKQLQDKALQISNTAAYYKNESEGIKKDFERYKERNKNIEGDAKIKANESVAKKLLPILDNFESAFSQVSPEIMRGFSMIYASLKSVLGDLGVVEYGDINDEMNPELYNCISTDKAPDENSDGKISKIYQKGYKFEGTDTVIRPATVSVYKSNL